MKKIFSIVALSATIAGFSQTDTTTTNKLNEVKLESQRYIKTKKGSQQIQTISQKDIEFGNYQNTADMLSNSGKLTVQKSQQGGGSPVIRGLEANRILLLVDGIRMNNLIFRGGHLQNVITIDENMLESTDILFGAASTPFGSDALGGAINLITKRPFLLSDTNSKKFSGSLNTRYSTVNKEKSIYGDFKFSGNKWATLTAFSFNDFGDLKMGSKKNGSNDFFGARPKYIETVNGVDRIVTNDNELIQVNSAYKQYNVMQKILYKPNATTEHSVNLQASTTSNIPRYDRLTDLKGNGDLKNATWNYGPQKRILAGYQFSKQKAILNSDLSIRVNYQNVEESRITRKYTKTVEETRTEKVNVFSLNADLKAKLGKGELVYGVDAFYDNLKSTANGQNVLTGENTKMDTRYSNGKNHTLKTEAFVTYFGNITENTSYNLGARGGYNILHSDIADNSFLNLPYTNIDQKNITYSAAAGIVNNSTKNIKFAFNLSTGFRTPNIDDVAKIFESGSGSLIVPNANLKPEKSVTGDLSVTLLDNDTFKFENTVFYTQLYDAIVTDTFLFNGQSIFNYNGTPSTVYANQNLGKANIFGYSSTIKAELFSGFNFYGNFNYTQGKIQLNGGGTAPLDHIAPIYGKTGFNYERKYFNLDLYMLYSGKKDIKDYFLNGEDNEQYAPANGMPAWQTYNFKAAIKPIKALTLFTGVENILDIQYRTFSSGINSPGRNFYAGAKINF